MLHMPDAATPASGDGANGGGMTQRRSNRKLRKELWDDLYFRHRVQDLARDRGLPLADLLRAAGVPIDYTYRTAEGRNTNVIMRLAELLDVSPTELLGHAWVPQRQGAAPVEPSPPPRPTPQISDGMLRLVERQNTTAIFIALAMVRGDRLGEIAEALGMRERDVAELLKQHATEPIAADKKQSE